MKGQDALGYETVHSATFSLFRSSRAHNFLNDDNGKMASSSPTLCPGRRQPRRCLASWAVVGVLFLLVVLVVCDKTGEKEANAGAIDPSSTESLSNKVDNNDSNSTAEAFLPVHVLKEEDGILVLTQVEHIPDALKLDNSPLLLVALYSPTCSHSMTLLAKLEEVAVRVNLYVESLLQVSSSSLDDDTDGDATVLLPPRIAKLDATRLEASWMKTLHIESYPTLLWFIPSDTAAADNTEEKSKDDDDDVWMMDYAGLQSTTDDLYHTILHAWYRTVFGTVWAVPSTAMMDELLYRHGPGLFRHVSPPIHPDFTRQERETIAWLMDTDSHNNKKEKGGDESDPFVVFVQCRRRQHGGGINDDADTPVGQDSYDATADSMSTRRDVVFFSVEHNDDDHDCGDQDLFATTDTVAILVPSHSGNWKRHWRQNAVVRHRQQDTTSIQQFIEVYSTPSLLWFDRVSVAPIAFAAYRKVHAVLFVPLAAEDENGGVKTSIRMFRKACQSQKRQGTGLVCLVVPHTETRIMTTFGMDIWTPLDALTVSSDSKEENVSSILPALMVTDQRDDGTLKYYMDATSIEEDPSAIDAFLDYFWQGRLSPFVRSIKEPLRRNKSNVQIITGDTFRPAVLDTTDKHTLLLMFAPSCGHCKRFSVLWNTLSRLIHRMKWDAFLDLAKLDVTQNAVITKELHLDVDEVPDVYYFPRGDEKHKPVRYDVRDEFGDGAGRLSDPLEIINWLLDIAHDPQLSEEALLRLLEAAPEETGDQQEAQEAEQ